MQKYCALKAVTLLFSRKLERKVRYFMEMVLRKSEEKFREICREAGLAGS